MYAKVIAESLMHYREFFLLLATKRKRLCQSCSSVNNSFIVLLFRFLRLLGLTEKLTNYTRDLYDYVIMIAARAMANF